jgi:lysophospholipase L1-like esterase
MHHEGKNHMNKLEKYEWCDFWWEETDKADKPRVLLIGDSITRAYRPTVNHLIRELAYVDMLATSKALDNPSLKRELDYILKHENFKYKVIHFNNGLHGWHLSIEEYEKYLDEVVRHIINTCESSILILALTTPVTIEGKTDEINEELTSKVIERNRVIEDMGRRYKLIIDDLYTPMFGNRQYRVDDGYHYNEIGEKIQAELVANKVKQFLL